MRKNSTSVQFLVIVLIGRPRKEAPFARPRTTCQILAGRGADWICSVHPTGAERLRKCLRDGVLPDEEQPTAGRLLRPNVRGLA